VVGDKSVIGFRISSGAPAGGEMEAVDLHLLKAKKKESNNG
jgi:hypothetical protein